MAISTDAIPKTVRQENLPAARFVSGLNTRPTWTYAVPVLLLTASSFALFEWVRFMLFPGLPQLRLLIIRVVAAATIAAMSGYVALRRVRAVERYTCEAMLARFRKEEACGEVRRQLAQKHREEQELRRDPQLLQAALDALSKQIAILDEQSTIIAVNQAWRRFAEENGFVGNNSGIGSRYFDFVIGFGDTGTAAAAQGFADVLRGQTATFRFLYPWISAGAQSWFELQVSRFTENGNGRLLVAQEDVTEVKLAQEAQRDVDNRILRSREEERKKIARELHDSTVQKIFAISLNLMALKTLLSKSEKKVQDMLAETMSLGRESMQELRTISYLLRPPLPAEHDFLPALDSYIDGFCKRSGIRVNLVLPSHAGRMPANVENTLFRVVQETLSNIHRHSQSASATVVLRKNEQTVVLEVTDKGKGMPARGEEKPFQTTGGGLAGIEERVHELGGSLKIKPGNPGTIVTATIPLNALNMQPGFTA